MIDLDKFKDWLDSPKAEEYFTKERAKNEMKDSQYKRFHENYSDRFEEIVDKIIAKYTSKEYRNSWYKKGYEPPEPLYWFLFHCATKYGKEATELEWEKYGNTFTSALYYYRGYIFGRMDGQGSIVCIDKII